MPQCSADAPVFLSSCARTTQAKDDAGEAAEVDAAGAAQRKLPDELTEWPKNDEKHIRARIAESIIISVKMLEDLALVQAQHQHTRVGQMHV